MQDELKLRMPVLVKKVGSATRVRFEIAPGQTIIGNLPKELRPQIIATLLVPQGDGSYRASGKLRADWVKLTSTLPAELNLDVDAKTLRRLAVAEIIESRHPSPNSMELNLHSLDAHLEGCRDPEYWIAVVTWPDGRMLSRLKKYKEAL